MIIYAIPLTAILTWLTKNAKGSVMPAVFFHYATNLYGNYLTGTEIFKLPLDMNFTQLKSILYWVIALILYWYTNGTFGHKSSDNFIDTN